jgi:zinc protease
MLRVVLPTGPGNERGVLDAALDVIARLRRDGCTADELEAARRVERNASEARRSTTVDWIALLAETHGDPDGLDRLANWRRVLDAVTLADVQRAAARILRPENLSTLVLRPKRD